MKSTKHVILVASALGLLSILALPYIEGVKLWDLRSSGASVQVYIALSCFTAGLLIAALAIARGTLGRGLGILTVVVYLLTLLDGAVHNGFKSGLAIGAKLMLIVAVVGLVASLVAAVMPERRIV